MPAAAGRRWDENLPGLGPHRAGFYCTNAHGHIKWVKGWSRLSEGHKPSRFHPNRLFHRSTLRPETPSACHWATTGSSREEGTNKPGYVTDDKQRGRTRQMLGQGFQGPTVEHVTSDLGSALLPSQTVSRFRERRKPSDTIRQSVCIYKDEANLSLLYIYPCTHFCTFKGLWCVNKLQ